MKEFLHFCDDEIDEEFTKEPVDFSYKYLTHKKIPSWYSQWMDVEIIFDFDVERKAKVSICELQKNAKKKTRKNILVAFYMLS